METAVRDSVLEWLDQQNFLPDSQFGFRPGCSVAMALACAQSDWIEAKSKGEFVGILAFDLTAAFDTIGHHVLIDRLKHCFGLSGIVLSRFKSYLQSETILYQSVASEHLPAICGGLILGPLLFHLNMFPSANIIRNFMVSRVCR